MSKALPCIVCAKTLTNVFEDVVNQPKGGTIFRSSGNYGSTVFDEIDASFLEVNICDDCLKAASEQQQILTATRIEHVTRSEYQPWRWNEFILTEEEINESLAEDD